MWKKRDKKLVERTSDEYLSQSADEMSATIARELIPDLVENLLKQVATDTIQEQLAGQFGVDLKRSYEAIFAEPWFKNRLLIGSIESIITAQCQYIAQTFIQESSTLDEQTTMAVKNLLERFPDEWDARSLARVAGLSVGGVVENIILDHQLSTPRQDSQS